MYKGKEVKIVFSEEANEIYGELNKIVGEEIQRGISSSFHQTLLRSITRAKESLKEDPFSGDQVPKRQIPKKYQLKYDAENSWRIELANRWRMIYMITGNQVEIVTFVMDIFNHKV